MSVFVFFSRLVLLVWFVLILVFLVMMILLLLVIVMYLESGSVLVLLLIILSGLVEVRVGCRFVCEGMKMNVEVVRLLWLVSV